MGALASPRAAEADRAGEVRYVADTMVDTGSEYTWIPRDLLADLGIGVERIERFVTADGRLTGRRPTRSSIVAESEFD